MVLRVTVLREDEREESVWGQCWTDIYCVTLPEQLGRTFLYRLRRSLYCHMLFRT